jgi:hypothetical protein
MLKKIALHLLGLSVSFSAAAGTMGDMQQASSPALPLSVGAYGGYGHVAGAYKRDGNVAYGRLALGLHVRDYKLLSLGIEAGVQSGNTMRLSANQAVVNAAGGLPAQSVLKPMVDALVTVKGQFSPLSPLVYILKGGIAFRQLQFQSRSSSDDTLSKVNGEFQAGLGYNVTDHLILAALYQAVYSTSQSGVRLNRVGDLTISNIPTQQAGLLGIEYTFN